MQVCLAQEQDMSQIRELWEFCFDDTTAFIDFFFDHRARPENTLAIFDGLKVCASLQLLPYQLTLRGKRIEAPYIVGVATWPEYRRKGYATELLKTAAKYMEERKQAVSLLLPFQYDFYRKVGWEVCYDFLSYQLDDGFSDQIPDRYNYTFIDTQTDIQSLSDCYHQFMKQYHGYIERSPEDWDRLLTDHQLESGKGLWLKHRNQFLGYMLYTIHGKIMMLKELIYIKPEAKKALLTLAYLHKEQTDTILWRSPCDDLFFQSMKDSRGKLRKETYVMGRIHNVQTALSGTYVNDTGSVVLKVIDPLYSENNQCFHLLSQNGLLQVTPSHQMPDVEISIGNLSQLLWGYVSVEQAWQNGLVQCFQQEGLYCLDRMFPLQKNLIFEDF